MWKFRINVILSKISKNIDFSKIFTKISILVSKNLYFSQIFTKISILVKILKNLDFGQIF